MAMRPAVRICPTQAGAIWILTIALAVGVLHASAAAQEKPQQPTILNQKSLSFVVDEIIRFPGPREQPIALHRILGIDQSLAMSQLSPDNRLVLINPHRILFGELGFVDTGEFLATALRLYGRSGAEAAVGASSVHLSEHGYIALLTPGVTTEAVVIAAVTTAASDAEQKILFDLMSDGLIRYAIGESELDQFTGVDGKALAKASSERERLEARPGQMLINARSAADIQRSVMNTGNLPRARRLVVQNGSIRLEGESPLEARVRPQSRQLFQRHADTKQLKGVQNTGMTQTETTDPARVNPMPSGLSPDTARVAENKSRPTDSAFLLHKRFLKQPPAVASKANPSSSEPTIERAESRSKSKGKTKIHKSSPHARAHQPKFAPSITSQGVLPEWMKYLPKSESADDSPAVP
jgi:filamentous hemagglutinin family protein